jgi:putative ABC transport system permease protein
MKRSDPLSGVVYVRRRFRHLLPQLLAMGLVTSLLIMIVTPTNTFRETTQANLRTLDAFTAVTPFHKPSFDSSLTSLLDRNPALERRLPVKVAWIRYPMLIGETFCPLVILNPQEIQDLMTRLGLALVEGRLPRSGRPEVLLHEDVARAKGLRLGSRVGPLVDRAEVTGMFGVVGIVRGRGRIGIATMGSGLGSQFLRARLPAYMLIYSRPGDKPISDGYLRGLREDNEPAFQVVDADYVRQRMAEALQNLPVLVTFLTFIASLAVASVVALLNIMAFQARTDEFAILLAIGQRRTRLAAKLCAECGLLGAAAWIVGAAGGVAAMVLYARYILNPRGIVMQPFDPLPILLTLMLPTIAVVASVLALWRKLRILDPVAAIERRFA